MGTATVQGELWGRAPQSWINMERRLRPLFEAMLDAVEPLDGKALLDAGCGAGLLAQLAGTRGAAVSGVDAAQGLLEVARGRTTRGEFQCGDIEALPCADATFDVVTAANAIQYAADPACAVRELARVCRPGGQVAIGVWGDPTRCETEALFGHLRSLAPPPPGTPAPLGVSAAGVVESVLETAGLRVKGGDEVSCPLEFADHDEAWETHSAAGPLQKVIDAVGADRVKAVLVEVLEADRKPDGRLRQDNVFRYVVAAKL
jgi:SAM-dependent methyltransferase